MTIYRCKKKSIHIHKIEEIELIDKINTNKYITYFCYYILIEEMGNKSVLYHLLSFSMYIYYQRKIYTLLPALLENFSENRDLKENR